MVKYYKCALCGKIMNSSNDAIDHAMSHEYAAELYSVPYFHVCPICNKCHDTSQNMDSCINAHIIRLKDLGYV